MSKPVELLGQARGVEEKIAPETVFIFKHFPLIKKQKNRKNCQISFSPTWSISKMVPFLKSLENWQN